MLLEWYWLQLEVHVMELEASAEVLLSLRGKRSSHFLIQKWDVHAL